MWSRNSVIQAAVRPASGDWQAPLDISPPGEPADSARLAVDGEGNVTVVWPGNGVPASIRPPSGRFGAPEQLVPGEHAFEPAVAVNATGATVVLWTHGGTGGELKAIYRPAGGSFGPAQDVTQAGLYFYETQLAVDPRGHALATWTAKLGANHDPPGVIQAADYQSITG